MTMNKKPVFRSRQQGATLLVALILLLVMTLVGIGAGDTAIMQMQMSRNSQFEQEAYQIALSEIQSQFVGFTEDLAPLTTAMNNYADADNGDDITEDGVEPLTGSELLMAAEAAAINAEQEAALVFVGDGAPPSGFTIGSFVGKRFDLNSDATIGGTSIGSSQTLGMNFAAPKGN
jgi:type II secretory pathway component PulK